MKLEVTSHHIINLIKEDIKVSHLLFGLQELGLECSPEMPSLSMTIFSMCGIDLEKDLNTMEAYYNLLNEARDHSFEELNQSLEALAEGLLRRLM